MKETVKMKLLKKLPKKYHERVLDFEQEDDLVDDCKYMLQDRKSTRLNSSHTS